MGFGFIIIIRILFVTCMVFIIGYVFGGFSKRPALAVITKVAAILIIVLFIATNIMAVRNNFNRFKGNNCPWSRCDTTYRQEQKHP